MKIKELLTESRWKERKGYVAIATRNFDVSNDFFDGIFAFRNMAEAAKFGADLEFAIEDGDFDDEESPSIDEIECEFDMLIKPGIVIYYDENRVDNNPTSFKYLCVGESIEKIKEDYEDELEQYKDYKISFVSLGDPSVFLGDAP